MWVDLTQPFHEEIPHSPAQPSPSFETLAGVHDSGANVQQYSATTHVGTHVDAPRHVISNGATIDELPLDRFVGEGVVLDVPQDIPKELTVQDIEGIAGAQEIQPNDLVLFNTGWCKKYHCSEYRPYPWLSEGVAEWLVDHDVKLVGIDTPSPDRPRAFRPDEWTSYPVHRILLKNSVPIVENLSLSEITQKRGEIYGFPIKIRNGDGAPARFVARM